MPSNQSRRRVLQVAGTAVTLSLAGCATVAEQLTGSQDSPKSGEGARTDTAAKTPPSVGSNTTSKSETAPESTTATGTETADATAQESWSIDSVTIEEPDISLSGVPLPDERTPYARMGTADADVIATVWGNWKCPYTQEFVLNQFPTIVDRFVRPGRLTVEFRSLSYVSNEPYLGPDSPRASRAGLGVWDIDPESYWSYFAHVFANQPQERYEWAQLPLLVRFAEASGVNGLDQLRQVIRSNAYSALVRRTTRAADELGIATVPRVVAGGDITAPTVDFETTLSQLETVVED